MSEPTVQDIARLAKVSLGTVSNVLNGRQSVREDLVIRVSDAARKLGYRRNSNAASLRSNQTDTVAVAVPNIENAFFAEIVSAIEHLGVSDRRGVVFLTTGEDQARAHRQIYSLISRRVDGLILVPSFDYQPMIGELETYGVPVVLIDRVESNNPFPSVAVDNRQAGRIGGQHLFAAGYRRIAFFGHAHDRWILNQRHEGFLEAARSAGASEFIQSYELSLDPEEIRQETLRILAGPDRPEAIFGASNIIAKGVIPAIQSLSLSIPEDIGLLVIDDFEALTLLNPGISVVAQPSEDIARVGWKMLLRLIDGEELDVQHVRLSAKLIERGSTKGPRRNGAGR